MGLKFHNGAFAFLLLLKINTKPTTKSPMVTLIYIVHLFIPIPKKLGASKCDINCFYQLKPFSLFKAKKRSCANILYKRTRYRTLHTINFNETYLLFSLNRKFIVEYQSFCRYQKCKRKFVPLFLFYTSLNDIVPHTISYSH